MRNHSPTSILFWRMSCFQKTTTDCDLSNCILDLAGRSTGDVKIVETFGKRQFRPVSGLQIKWGRVVQAVARRLGHNFAGHPPKESHCSMVFLPWRRNGITERTKSRRISIVHTPMTLCGGFVLKSTGTKRLWHREHGMAQAAQSVTGSKCCWDTTIWHLPTRSYCRLRPLVWCNAC